MFPNYLPTAAKTVRKRVFPVSFVKASDEDILSGYYMNAKGEEMKIEKELSKNMTEIDSILCIKENFDIVSRLFTICGKRACVYYIDGFADDATSSKFFETLQSTDDGKKLEDATAFSRACIPFGDIAERTDIAESCTDILSGRTLLLVDGFDTGFAVDFRKYSQRSVSEPDKEKVMRGSKDSFVEALTMNAALIRRRIRSEELRIEYFNVGRVSKTDIAVCYLNDRVNKKHLDILKKKLRSIKTDALTMNQQSLADLLIKRTWIDPFPKFRYTERVDTASAQIMEGDILVIVDNAPSVMMMPVTLFDVMEEANDYYFPPLTGTYLRLVRYAVTVLTTFMTPLWLLCLAYPENVPETLHFVLLDKPPNIPVIVQLLILEIAVDGLKLASLNTPSMMTTSMSMIGGIIVGDFAVKSGWFNAECMLYMAVVALANFSLPSTEMSYALKFVRIICLLTTYFFGLWGFVAGIAFCVLSVAFNRSVFGFTFLYPLIPFNGKRLLKKFFRLKLRSDGK